MNGSMDVWAELLQPLLHFQEPLKHNFAHENPLICVLASPAPSTAPELLMESLMSALAMPIQPG